MEVGAVKQAFNNEVILLKKELSQAKIQIIHKLTRKAKQLTEKKSPESMKDKLKRKAESAINEVMILKKIKPNDLAKFIVTHEGELKKFLNTSKVDKEKACARLLLHKALQVKYKFIRDRFSNVPIKDLFMSRLERRKMKKEEKEKRKNKKNAKNNKVINSEGDWEVEDIDKNNETKLNNNNSENDDSQDDIQHAESENESVHDDSDDDGDLNEKEADNPEPKLEECMQSKQSSDTKTPIGKLETENRRVKPTEIRKKQEHKQRDVKSKNFKEKIQQKKFKKDSHVTVVGNKIVDPFFITSTGENYMSVVEPRGPDEVKDEHKQGNRKLRRAVMFGHVPNTKLRQDNYNYRNDNRFNNQNGYEERDNFRNKFDNRQKFEEKRSFNNNFNDRKRFNAKNCEDKPEKLHPSWEAKKKKSGILPFEGKKIVFD